jgi:hypothetical protein
MRNNNIIKIELKKEIKIGNNPTNYFEKIKRT